MMRPVFVYAADAESLADSGLCGDLQPESAIFVEELNGISMITMTLRYDKYKKWNNVKTGCYLKAEVPVRVPPEIVDGDYAETVTRYETVNSRVNVYAWNDALSKVSAVAETGTKLYGRDRDRILGNFVPATTVVEEPGEGQHIFGGGTVKKRLVGYFPKSSLRKIDEIAIVPASYGMESVEDLVTRMADQYFTIVDVEQKDDEIIVTAEHVFYELSHVYTKYKTAEGQEASGSTVVNGILSQSYNVDERFSISSSCAETQTGIDYDRKSVVEALLDPKAGAMKLFNMRLLRDNYNIYCLPAEDVGFDRGFVVEYGKNMTAIDRKENIENLVTRVMPFGKDASGNVRWMTGTPYVDSDNWADYNGHPMEILDTGLTVGKDGVTEANIDAKMREAAEKEFSEGKVNYPEVQLKVSFLSLGDTEEYRQFRGLDKVYLYDKITVKDSFRGFTYQAEVVAVKHDILTGMLEEVTLGSIANSDGKRKIATWQVPTISGENIRLKSIQLGALADGSVGSDALMNGAVTTLHLASATIDDLTTESLTAVQAQIEELIAGHVTAEAIVAGAVTADAIEAGAVTTEKIDSGAVTADKIDAGAITADKIAANAITAGKIAANAVGANQIQAGTITANSGIIANGAITNAMIGTGAVNTAQIADGSITDAKIVGLTANKITAGTLDAGTIEVVNLNAANITVGKINGQQIASGTIALTNLASGVQTSIGKIGGMETAIETLQDEVDAAIETWYYNYEPTLTNAPASSWTTDALKQKHQGDLFYSKASGYSYRFLKDGSTWTWVQLRDSDLTEALARVAALEDDVESIETELSTAQSTITSLQTDLAGTQEELEGVSDDLETTQTDLTATKARLTTAEQTITTKADGSTVTALSNTVSGHTETISSLEDRIDTAEETIETKADGSTVQSLSNTVASHTTTIGQIEDRVTDAEEAIETKADGTTVQALSTTVAGHTTSIGNITSRVTSAEQSITTKADASVVQGISNTVASHTTSIGQIEERVSEAEEVIETKADGSTVETLSNTVAGHTTSIGSITTRVTNAEQAITTKADGSTVTALSNTVSGHTTSIGSITTRVTNAEQAITTKADGSTVTALSNTVSGHTTAIGSIEDRVEAAEEEIETKADGSTVDTLSTTVAGHTTSLQGISSRLSTAEQEIETKADGSTVTALSNRVTSVEETTEGIETSVSSLDTRVTTAQNTANAKVKTYAQASQPTSGMATGDLWIDTDDANKLYRYSGSAWVAMRDNHLDATVTSHSTTIAQHTTAIEARATKTELNELDGRVETAEAAIVVNTEAIETKVSQTDFTGATIASKINQSPTTVQLEAQHINLVGAVTATDLAAGAVTTDKIAANAITSAKIAAEAITSDKIVAEAITAEKIAAEAVTANAIVSGAITTDKLDASAVTADKIAAGTVTLAKLASNVGQGIDISANTYLQSTIGSWTSTHENSIVDEIAGINRTIGELGRGQIFFSTTEPSDPAVGDIWIKPTNRLTHADLASYTHEELAEFRYMDLGRPPEQYVYNGNGWEMINDSSMYTVLQTQLEQTDEKIALKASIDQLGLTNERVTAAEAGLEIQAESIAAEVTARQTGDAEAEANAKAACIAKTSTLQTADQIVDSAKTYTDGQLTNYSTLTQTSQQISAAVAATTKTFRQASAPTSGMHDGDLWFDSDDGNKPYRYNGSSWVATDDTKKYTVQSGIDINANGVDISGGKYIRMKTGNQTNMELSPSGIQMNTAGQFNVHAMDQKGSIVFGTSESDATFAVGDQGNLHAESIDTNSLNVNGLVLPGIVVSESQPSGHGILWIKPSSTSEKSWVYTPENRSLSQVGGTLGRYRDYSIPYTAEDYLAGNLFYGIVASLYVYSSTAVGSGFDFKAILNPANQNIVIGSTSGRVYTAGTNIDLNVMLTSLKTNVLSPSGGYLTIRLETNCDPTWCRLDRSITVKAKSQSGSGVSACSVFYVS